MHTVNMHEAKTHLSRLVEEANAGEEVVIAKAGKPMVRLVPTNTMRGRRVLGWLAGKLEVPEDFDAPLPEEVLADFEGCGDARLA
ncbi:type II toxin-antitoxin system Phd/YefM family antitoxin [Candidatus Fermentibacteria bacterium]|nr:type II toxin-antitoxin system Phd/YefM family antitoxin [Candidatus Fermentibacteria bacterium]